MWCYEKRLQFPVEIKKPDAKTAQIVISQLGGPNGELGAALRYLSQRFSMPYPRIQALLTDIGTEEYALFCCMCFYIKTFIHTSSIPPIC